MKLKVWIFISLLLVSTILLLLPSVSAQTLAWPAPSDFGSNFDNFAAGVQNPFPWTFTGTTSGCTGGCSNPSEVGVVNNSQYRSAPNSYQIKQYVQTAIGSSGPYTISGYVKANFNATEGISNVTIYWNNNIFGVNAATNCGTQLLVNSTIQTKQTSVVTLGCTSSTFAKLSVIVATSPGSLVSVFLKTNMTASEGGGIFYIGYYTNFDDFSIVGAAAYTSSQGGPAINFRLLNTSSAGPYWFDPTGYTGSYVTTQWASAFNNSNNWANAPSSGLSVAAMNITNGALNLTTATLVTVNIGGSYPYYRTLIPAKSGITSMYLDNPLDVNSYYFTINSPGFSVAGDYFFITQADHNVTSGYVDSAPSFSAWLSPGTYDIQIVDKSSPYNSVFSGSYILTPSSSTAQTQEQITILNQTVAYQATQYNGISVGLNLTSSTSLYSVFSDTTNAVTMANMTLYYENTSGTYAIEQACFSTSAHGSCTVEGSIGSVSHTFTVQSNLTQQYYVIYTFVRSGTYSIGPYLIFGGNSGQVQGNGGVSCILGICVLLTTSFQNNNNIMLDIVSVFLIIALGSAFSPKFASFGTLIVVIITGLLMSIHWVNLSALGAPALALGTQGILAALAYMNEKEKEAANTYNV